jgi:hypothetical protein
MKKFFVLVLLVILSMFIQVQAFAFDADDILLCKKTYSNGVSKYAFPSGSTGMCPSDWQTISLQDALSGMLTDLNERVSTLENTPGGCSTEVPENDYVYITNVNSGWVNVPMDYFRGGEGWYELLLKPDGRPYSNYYYDGYWHRTYYYKLRCTVNPDYLTARYPEAMGGAVVFPGLQMCE